MGNWGLPATDETSFISALEYTVRQQGQQTSNPPASIFKPFVATGDFVHSVSFRSVASGPLDL